MTAAKILLLSVVVGMVLIPILTARDANAQHGLKKTLLLVLVFNLLYLFAIQFIYPHLT